MEAALQRLGQGLSGPVGDQLNEEDSEESVEGSALGNEQIYQEDSGLEESDEEEKKTVAEIAQEKYADNLRRFMATRATTNQPRVRRASDSDLLGTNSVFSQREQEQVSGGAEKAAGDEKKSQEENEVCGICLEGLTEDNLGEGLSCRHTFHPACIVQWFSQGNLSCLTCRNESEILKQLAEKLRSQREIRIEIQGPGVNTIRSQVFRLLDGSLSLVITNPGHRLSPAMERLKKIWNILLLLRIILQNKGLDKSRVFRSKIFRLIEIPFFVGGFYAQLFYSGSDGSVFRMNSEFWSMIASYAFGLYMERLFTKNR